MLLGGISTDCIGGKRPLRISMILWTRLERRFIERASKLEFTGRAFRYQGVIMVGKSDDSSTIGFDI